MGGEPPASTGTRWRAERLIGENESAVSGVITQRFRELGRYGTKEEAQQSCQTDAAMGAKALFGLWYITDMVEMRYAGSPERVAYRPPNAHLHD